MSVARRFWAGPALTLAAVLLGHATWRLLFPGDAVIPGAALAPLFLATVLATFLGGRGSGLASAGVATAYMLYVLWLAFEPVGAMKLVLITASLYANVLLVGSLKHRMDAALAAERATSERERRLAAEATRANDALRANNETLETFVYVITHDLKEPVRAVDHHLEQTGREYGTPRGSAALEHAVQTNRRLAVLLQRLLDYSRASLATPSLRALTLEDVLAEPTCRTVHEHALLTRRAKLEYPRVSAGFLADPTLLGQALGNLILNAIKHNPRESPRVTLLAQPAGEGMVDLVLQDDGPGFPPGLLERFQRLKPNRAATLSGGFGLVIARRAVERMGGVMTLSNLTEGAEVRIRLPAATPSPSRRVPVEERVPDRHPEAAQRNSP